MSGAATPMGWARDRQEVPEASLSTLRFIDWIWHVRGSVPLPPGQSMEEAFDRLDPVFREVNTTRRRLGDTLIFEKKDQAAQDKMSVFDGGTLRIDRGPAGAILRYHLVSRALLFCFLAPLLFLAAAQITNVLVNHKASPAQEKADAQKKAAAKEKPIQLNPIDKFLGAPEPEKPGKKEAEKANGRRKKLSATPAYVFAGIFAFLYVFGRILEARLVRKLFRTRLGA